MNLINVLLKYNNTIIRIIYIMLNLILNKIEANSNNHLFRGIY